MQFLRYEEQQNRRREKVTEGTADLEILEQSKRQTKEQISRKRKGEVRKSKEKRKTLETE
jgi:hypothetical protein